MNIKIGTLVLIKEIVGSSKGNVVVTDPIIVCDDEIEQPEKVYQSYIKQILEKEDCYPGSNASDFYQKILVDTPQIPQNVIDAIISGELKDGDEVEVIIHENPEGRQYVKLDIDGKAVIFWNIDKSSPEVTEQLYTEEEVNVLLSRLSDDISGHLGFKITQFIKNWWKQNKKK